ncbi:hypothetical protein [Chryseobacterium sp. c4a]|uniref:hypothetical protein n=1 Tax=Chryseobacterium sp. c4a TaxID=1573582 RepID=UPI00135772F5|nr:hypothetical protein [Chryseobacterium sp. c4a]
MILIFSNEKEPTTDMVIDWLLYKKAPFIRLNSEDILNNKSLYIDVAKGIIKINDMVISIDEINVVWYRRWNEFGFQLPKDIPNRSQLNFELSSELNEISSFIFMLLSGKKTLCNPFANKNHNKLYTLYLAHKHGINIAPSFIVNSVTAELDTETEYITKPISDSKLIVDKDQNFCYKSFTEKMDLSAMNDGESFFPSLLQGKIDSAHEIRCFYLDGKFFPTAILNSKTLDIKRSVGFDAETVRMIPFKFPEEIETKITGLMKDLGLNCGAIDIIKTTSGEFYFLEVNPVGQIIGYSTPTNYTLEKEVAEWLINNDYE